MKKFLLLTLLSGAVSSGFSQISIYVKFTTYEDKVITDGVVRENPHKDEIPLTTFSDNDEQTLNIGSQATGAGAGKVTFNPLTFSKPVDVSSPLFFKMMASGTPFKKVEFSFYRSGGSNNLVFRETLSLAAFKSIQHVAASCTGDCPGVIENYLMEFGSKVLTVYTQNANGSPGTPVSFGWNRVKNIPNDDPAATIK